MYPAGMHYGVYLQRRLVRTRRDALPAKQMRSIIDTVLLYLIALFVLHLWRREQVTDEWYWGMSLALAFALVAAFRFAWSFLAAPYRMQREADELQRVTEDERDAALGQIDPMPPGFVSARRAVKHLVESRKHQMVHDATGVEFAADAMVNCARDGSLTIWGKPKNSTRCEPISVDLWKIMKIDFLDLCADDGSSGRTHQFMQVTGYKSYSNLCVEFSALQSIWPEDRSHGRQVSGAAQARVS